MGWAEYKRKRDFKKTAEPRVPRRRAGEKRARYISLSRNMMPAACITISGWKWRVF
jgi:hypothetical protein